MNQVKIDRHRQAGLSFIGWIVILGFFSFLVLTFFKVFPMYYQSFQVRSILQSIQEDPTIDARSKRAIWEAMQKRLYINDIKSIDRANVKMSRKEGKTTVVVSYEARDTLVGNLFIGGEFNETVVIDR